MIRLYVPNKRLVECVMGHGEVATVFEMWSVAGLAWMGASLAIAIWSRRRPRAMWVGAAITAALVVSWLSTTTPPASGESTLVAGVASTEPPCLVGSRLLHQQYLGERAHLTGTGVAAECGLWAIIEDPRTGGLWLQGPAIGDAHSWTLDLVLGPGENDAAPLAYQLSLLVVTEETHAAWSALAASNAPLALGAAPASQLWLARDLPVRAGPPK